MMTIKQCCKSEKVFFDPDLACQVYTIFDLNFPNILDPDLFWLGFRYEAFLGYDTCYFWNFVKNIDIFCQPCDQKDDMYVQFLTNVYCLSLLGGRIRICNDNYGSGSSRKFRI